MLAQRWGLQLKGLGKFREPQCEAWDIHIAEEAVMNRSDRSSLAQVRMLEGLGYGQNGRDRNMVLFQRRNGRVITRLRAKPRLNGLHQFVQMIHPRLIVGKARVSRQFGLPHCLAQLGPVLLQRRDQNHIALTSLEHASGSRIPRMRSRAGRVYFSFAQAVHLKAGLMVVRIGIEQRQVQVLSTPGPLAV